MALIDKLSAIGDAIREKTGNTELLTLDEMPTEIAAIQTGGGGVEIEPIVLTGTQSYGCAGVISSKFIELYPNKISTKNITSTQNMFANGTLKKIPFSINMSTTAQADMSYTFANNSLLEEIPQINDAQPSTIASMFGSCRKLNSIPENFGENWNWNRLQTYNYAAMSNLFSGCNSLFKIPQFFLSKLKGAVSSQYSTLYYNGFSGCYALSYVYNLPVQEATYTGNMFMNTFRSCCRLKDMTFETNEDGSSKTVQWKNQTITLSNDVGYGDLSNVSGLPSGKRVTDDATYQALKNDEYWWTGDYRYSRYNHDSAVATINSLPDTSAYLATAGGTNTLSLYRYSGELTDGGAVGNLTEEEIAVATAKGWTVSFA